MEDSVSVIGGTRRRLRKGVLESDPLGAMNRLPRIPLTGDEVRERLHLRHSLDAVAVFGLLADLGSGSSRLFLEWHLSRNIVRAAFRDFCADRRQQVTLASALTVSGFKYFASREDELLRTQCAKCGGTDSGLHMIECCNLGVVPFDAEEITGFLVATAAKVGTAAPGVSVPVQNFADAEVELFFENEIGNRTATDEELSLCPTTSEESFP